MQTMRNNYLDGEWETICKLLSFDQEQPNFSSNLLEEEYINPTNNNNNNYENISTNSYFSYENNSNNINNNGDNNNSIFEQNYCMLDDYSTSNEVSLCFDIPVNGENDGLFGLMFVDSSRNEVISSKFENNNVCNENCMKRKKVESEKDDEDEEAEAEASVCQSLLATPKKKKGRVSGQNKKMKVQGNKIDEKELEVVKKQSFGPENSEDESNQSEDSKTSKSLITTTTTTITTTTGKKRASRGEATDPQSLYARRRRRRINERLRILQGLVPNGTKVDISTMLEEAFHYVKFLQLQIRLLSSDDLWMYAPMAYSGFDVSVYGHLLPK